MHICLEIHYTNCSIKGFSLIIYLAPDLFIFEWGYVSGGIQSTSVSHYRKRIKDDGKPWKTLIVWHWGFGWLHSLLLKLVNKWFTIMTSFVYVSFLMGKLSHTCSPVKQGSQADYKTNYTGLSWLFKRKEEHH